MDAIYTELNDNYAAYIKEESVKLFRRTHTFFTREELLAAFEENFDTLDKTTKAWIVNNDYWRTRSEMSWPSYSKESGAYPETDADAFLSEETLCGIKQMYDLFHFRTLYFPLCATDYDVPPKQRTIYFQVLGRRDTVPEQTGGLWLAHVYSAQEMSQEDKAMLAPIGSMPLEHNGWFLLERFAADGEMPSSIETPAPRPWSSYGEKP